MDTVVLAGDVNLVKRIDGSVGLETTVDGQTATYIGGGALQEKTVAPTAEEQLVLPDAGYTGMRSVVVQAIPNNYGLITWNGSFLTVS